MAADVPGRKTVRLTPNTAYTYTAYSDSTCTTANQLASVNFTATRGAQGGEGGSGDSKAETPPDPVTNIKVTHNGSSLTVTWDAPEGAPDSGDGQDALRMGVKLTSGPHAEAALELGRRAGQRGLPEHAVQLQGRVRW